MRPSAEKLRAELERAGVLDSNDEPVELSNRGPREAQARRRRCHLSPARAPGVRKRERALGRPRQRFRCAAVDRIGCTRGSVRARRRATCKRLRDPTRPCAGRGLPVVAKRLRGRRDRCRREAAAPGHPRWEASDRSRETCSAGATSISGLTPTRPAFAESAHSNDRIGLRAAGRLATASATKRAPGRPGPDSPVTIVRHGRRRRFRGNADTRIVAEQHTDATVLPNRRCRPSTPSRQPHRAPARSERERSENRVGALRCSMSPTVSRTRQI